MLGVKTGWHFDDDTDVQVAVAVALHVFHTLASEAQDGAGLCAGGDVDARLAAKCRHLYLGAQRCLHEADRHLAEQVVSVAFENLVVADEARSKGRPVCLR